MGQREAGRDGPEREAGREGPKREGEGWARERGGGDAGVTFVI